MEAFGQPSRLLGKFLGNAWTYVSAAEEDPAAPGQFSLELARDVYRIGQWQTVPELYGVIGNPVGDLTSVLIHNRLFEHYDREALFLPLQLDEIEPWFEYMEATRLRFKGLAVAAPFENFVRLHAQSPSAPGDAIDTLKREGPEWVGLSTANMGRIASEGKGMILEQAAEQFRIWTGIDPDRNLIREVLDA
jgi:shikimate 5-dehydrogenase